MQKESPKVGFAQRMIDALLGGPRALTVEDSRVGLRFTVSRQLLRNLNSHSRKFPITMIEDWVENPTCTSNTCGSEVVRLIPAVGTFAVTEACPGCKRRIPLEPEESGEHARYEVHVPLPKLKRAVFSALRTLKLKGVQLQGKIDVDLVSTLAELAR